MLVEDTWRSNQFMEDGKATVFATDSVLSLLMCSTRTVYPWDIVVKKIGDKVILDKRPGSAFGNLNSDD